MCWHCVRVARGFTQRCTICGVSVMPGFEGMPAGMYTVLGPGEDGGGVILERHTEERCRLEWRMYKDPLPQQVFSVPT